MNFTDIHTHIIYDIDDGAKTLEESIRILNAAKEKGVKAICFTPHCFISEPVDIAEAEQKTRKLQDETDIQLYYGCELMMEDTLPEFIEQNPGMCLGNGKYVLIELPMFHFPIYVKNVLYQLKLKGFSPIIAHPERNIVLQKKNNAHLFDEILENGLIQINAGSLTGKYGKKAKKTAMKLIKEDMVSIVASDTHDSRGYEHINEAFKLFVKIQGRDEAEEAFRHNPNRVLEGEAIQ